MTADRVHDATDDWKRKFKKGTRANYSERGRTAAESDDDSTVEDAEALPGQPDHMFHE